MSAESALYAALSGLPGLTALVSTRIYPDVIPEDAAMPAVVTARIGTEPVIGIGGSKFGEFAQMTVSAWAPTRTLAESVGDQIAEALRVAGNPAGNRLGGYDEESGLFASTLETAWFTAD